jgi:ribosome recycling factor
MTTDIKKTAEIKMIKSLEKFKQDLAKIRTGRAHTGILDHIQIDYYGTLMPINQIATLSVSDSRTITVQVWEAKMAGNVEKAIRDCGLGLNPVNAGAVLRIPMPPLTEERRKELIKVVRDESETAKIAIRNIRRDANNEFKAKLKEKVISEDEEKRSQDEIQKITDKNINVIDALTQDKEKELLTI